MYISFFRDESLEIVYCLGYGMFLLCDIGISVVLLINFVCLIIWIKNVLLFFDVFVVEF